MPFKWAITSRTELCHAVEKRLKCLVVLFRQIHEHSPHCVDTYMVRLKCHKYAITVDILCIKISERKQSACSHLPRCSSTWFLFPLQEALPGNLIPYCANTSLHCGGGQPHLPHLISRLPKTQRDSPTWMTRLIYVSCSSALSIGRLLSLPIDRQPS